MGGSSKCSLSTEEKKTNKQKNTLVLQWKKLDTLKGQHKNNNQDCIK